MLIRPRRSLSTALMSVAVLAVLLLTGTPARAQWIGATSAATNDAAHSYITTANWTGGTITDSFSGINFTAATTLFFGGGRTTIGDLNLGYSGVGALTISGGGTVNATGGAVTGAVQTLTLGGNIVGDFGTSANNLTVTLGSTTTASGLTIALGAADRSFSVSAGDTLNVINNISGARALTKLGSGTLNLGGNNQFTGGLNINAGTVTFVGGLPNLGSLTSAISFDTGTLTWTAGNVTDISVKTVTINAGGATFNTGTNNFSLANPIGNNGTGGLTKLGAGTLTLLGANTFTGGYTNGAGITNFSALNNFGTGGITLGGGTMQWASGTSTDISARTVTINTTTSLDTNGNTVTLANAIGNSGAGGLTKTGAGTLILQGTNTWAGTTTVNNGVLQFDNVGAIAGSGANVSVASGGTATTNYAMDQAFLGRIVAGSAGVIGLKADTGALSFSALTAARLGAIGSVTYTGALTPNGTTYRLGGGGGTLTVSSALGDNGGPTSLDMGLGGTASGTVILAGANNYTGTTAVNGGILQFANSGAITGLGANSVTANAAGAVAFDFTGVQAVINTGVAAASAGTIAVTATSAGENVDFNTPGLTNAFLGAAGGAVTYTGTFTPNGTTYKLGGGGGTLNYGAAIPAGNSVVIGGGAGGTVVLSNAANGFDGGLTLNGSTLQFSALGNLGSAANAITFAGGTLQWGSSNTSDPSSGGRVISINAGGATLDTNGNNVIIGSAIGNSGAGTFTKVGAGTLTLSVDNTFTGATSIKGGTVAISTANGLGTGAAAITVSAGGALKIDGTTAVSMTKPLTLNGTGVANGGALVTSGTVGFAGVTTIGSATLINALSGTTTFATGAFNGGANAITITGPGTVSVTSTMTHTGPLTVDAGNFDLTNSNDTILGPITVKNGGVLSFANQLDISNSTGSGGQITLDGGTLWSKGGPGGGTFSPGSRDIVLAAGGGTLRWDDTTASLIIIQTTPLPGTGIIGTGGLTKEGTGVIALATAATYTGPTIVNNGTFRVRTTSNRFPIATALTVNSPGIFDLNGVAQQVGSASGAGSITLGSATLTISLTTGTTDFTGVISGTGGVTKAGASTQTLSGLNSYAGVTSINGGILAINTIVPLGSANSSLGNPSTVANGTIGIGNTTTAGTLRYVGATNASTDRVIDLKGTTGGATIDSSGANTGSITFTSALTASGVGSKTLTLTGTNTGANTISGAIIDNSAANITTVTKSGVGTWALSGTSSFTGALNIGGGILNVATLSDYGVNSAIGARLASQENTTTTGIGIHIQANGTLQYTGATPQSTNREIRIINGLTPTIDASGSVPTATLTFSHTGANINLFDTAGTRTLNLTGSNTGDNTFAISLTDQSTNATSLNKAGAGTWVLTGVSTNTGSTTVSAGTLKIGATGSIANSSQITVGLAAGPAATLDVSAVPGGFVLNAGQKLGGSGTVVGNVTVASGATLTPGNSIGTLNVAGMTWQSGGSYNVEHNPDAPTSDLVNGGGTLDLSALNTAPFTLNLVSTPGVGGVQQTYTIATFANGIFGAGGVPANQFANGADVSSLFTLAGQFSAAPTTYATILGNIGSPQSIQVTFTPVPEPGMVLLACGAGAGFMAWRRRRAAIAA
jgi:fibronectin-binding autotransporter adhesin